MEAFEGSFRQTISFRSYREQTLNAIHQQEKKSIADLHTRLTVLLKKCNYNTGKVDLFFSYSKILFDSIIGKGQPADLAYDRLLDKGKGHVTAVAEYHQDRTAGRITWLS